jgi:predicted transcriptional regulator
MSEHYAFVTMTKEKYWLLFRERSLQGKKIHSFVSKGAAPPKATRILLFYVSNPVKAIDGYADFIERKLGTPEDVWNEHGDESVLESKQSFLEFIGDPERVSFIRFANLKKASNPISLSNLRMLLGVKRLSRKGFYLNKNMTHKLISMME